MNKIPGLIMLFVAGACGAAADDGNIGAWLQWAGDAQHNGSTGVFAQSLGRNLFNIVYDANVPEEQAAVGGDLHVHYQVPLVDENGDVYMEFKSGRFDPESGIFGTQNWSEKKLIVKNGRARVKWSFTTDWRPPGSLADYFEPVFQPAIHGESIYLPGAGGTLLRINKNNGNLRSRINPFGAAVDPTIFAISPITADADGNIYYNAVKLSAPDSAFLPNDVVESWLIKASRRGDVTTVSYKALVPNAPTSCLGTFATNQLPWPPSPDAVPPSSPCGTVRVAINSAPAVGPDGAIYNVARSHFNGRYAWLVAANPDLTPRWAATLRDRLNDGCRDSFSQPGNLPLNGAPGGCRAGARAGVDPATNRPGGGRILDDASSSVVIAPDGILYGAYNRYNYSQGHLMKFDFNGQFTGSFGFGWDMTPAIYRHNGTYSVIVKNNHYGGGGSYCNDSNFCPGNRTATNPNSPEAYFLSQLNAQLQIEWSYRNDNSQSCSRNADDSLTCVNDHPAGFEWCVNAPVVDQAGVVYANSEDGNLYAINQGGTLYQRIFQQLALGAAYTPMSIGPDGLVYSQNAGRLFIVGK